MEVIIQIYNKIDKKIYQPPVEEGIQWETYRKGSPGKLTFTVIKTDGIMFTEGDQVKLIVDDKVVFFGYVFQKSRNKDHHIEVTAYDQLRYLKNASSYQFVGVRADQVLKRIADDFNLSVGNLPNTGFVIPRFEADTQSLFDIVLTALDYTVINTKNLYYLYDDCGRLMLENIKDSKIDLIIHDGAAEDFDYTSSIDSNTYNRVVVVNSEDNGASKVEFEQDKDRQRDWGILQCVVQVDNGANAKEQAKALLKLHNRVQRSLTVNGVFGDLRARAGKRIYLDFNLGDLPGKQEMLIEKAVHTFENGHHYMELQLIGCEEFYD